MPEFSQYLTTKYILSSANDTKKHDKRHILYSFTLTSKKLSLVDKIPGVSPLFLSLNEKLNYSKNQLTVFSTDNY